MYEQIELPVIAPTLAMTLAGVPFNTDTLEQLANTEGAARANATALLRHVQADGRVYADLDPLGAVTGRYSCREPNLQGLSPALLPPWKRRLAICSWRPTCPSANSACWPTSAKIRACWPLSATECRSPWSDRRCCAWHRREQVTDEQRGIGKQVNFAIVYGMAADSLAQRLGISPAEARRCWMAISRLILVCVLGLPRSMPLHTKIARYAR